MPFFKKTLLSVFLIMLLCTFIGALPYFFLCKDVTLPDAFFQSAAAFTTSGVNIIDNIFSLPGLYLYKTISSWVGGLFIIIITTALGGAFNFYSFNLSKNNAANLINGKITKKSLYTILQISFLYTLFTLILFLLYIAGGMSIFNSFNTSLSIISTSSIVNTNTTAYIKTITIIFMLFGACNYNIYLYIIKRKFAALCADTELKTYSLLVFCAVIIIAVTMISGNTIPSSIISSAYYSAAIITTTGTPFELFSVQSTVSSFAQTILIILLCIGGCSHSGAGGIKVIRFAVLWKQAVNELKRIASPYGVFTVQINKKIGRKDIGYSVSSFVFCYVLSAAAVTLAGTLFSIDIKTALVSALSLLSTCGIGIDYSQYHPALKIIYAITMIAGRLEIIPVVILCTKTYRSS
jgi:trk system potassium uptake protein TrkH